MGCGRSKPIPDTQSSRTHPKHTQKQSNRQSTILRYSAIYHSSPTNEQPSCSPQPASVITLSPPSRGPSLSSSRSAIRRKEVEFKSTIPEGRSGIFDTIPTVSLMDKELQNGTKIPKPAKGISYNPRSYRKLKTPGTDGEIHRGNLKYPHYASAKSFPASSSSQARIQLPRGNDSTARDKNRSIPVRSFTYPRQTPGLREKKGG